MVNQRRYEEYIRRLGDRSWRLHNLYKIQNERGQKVKFTPNWAQLELLEDMHDKNVILKARQLGFTTFIQIFMLDTCVFNSDVNAGVIAHNREDAEDFFNKKIKYAYEHMPEQIKALKPSRQDSAKQLTFDNNSSIRVGTSLRSGTYQLLHISEYGKISAKYPDKAKEVKSGALNTLHEDSIAWIESTAEGHEGEFFETCQEAQRLQESSAELTRLDYKFFFFAWWQHPAYSLPGDRPIPQNFQDYFAELAGLGIELTQAQKNWYVAKAKEQKDDMKKEFPSTPEEAFEASIEGAYFAKEMAYLRKNKRICSVPYEASLPVNTFWDLGMSDSMVVWFHQRVGLENRFIDYLEVSGEGFPALKRMLEEKGYTYGEHYGPHDLAVRELNTGVSRLQSAADIGIKFEVVDRPNDKMSAIEAARGSLSSCWFDQEKCAQGVKHLDSYRKEWDDKLGVFKNKPRHDAASHGADAFMTFATGYSPKDASGWGKLNYSTKGIV